MTVISLKAREWVRVPTDPQSRTVSGAVPWPKATGNEELAVTEKATGVPLQLRDEQPDELLKPPRRDKGRRLLTERDRVVLTWMAEQYGAPVDQLQRLLARDPGRRLTTEGSVSLSGARHVVRRWEEGGYAESRKFFFKEQPWAWPTRKTLRHLRLDLPAYTPTVGLIDHHRWVNETRLYLEGPNYPGEVTWRAERFLKSRDARSGEIHYADAEAEVRGITVAIEVELSQKKQHDLRLILGELVGRYELVWYYTNTKARPAVERAVQGLTPDQQEQVEIYALEKLPEIG